MTTEERIALIRDRARRDSEEKAEQERRKELEKESLKLEILSLKERISAIITLANECKNNGVKIPESKCGTYKLDAAIQYGYDAEFIAEGIRHHVGLINTSPFRWLGIDNGGACGPYDFRTNGCEVFSIHETEHFWAEPRTCDMKQFLVEFPVFEKAFYNWIDTM